MRGETEKENAACLLTEMIRASACWSGAAGTCVCPSSSTHHRHCRSEKHRGVQHVHWRQVGNPVVRLFDGRRVRRHCSRASEWRPTVMTGEGVIHGRKYHTVISSSTS
jgi:hypothetical protein